MLLIAFILRIIGAKFASFDQKLESATSFEIISYISFLKNIYNSNTLYTSITNTFIKSNLVNEELFLDLVPCNLFLLSSINYLNLFIYIYI